MLRYLRSTDLAIHPVLAATMFTDRRRQFRDRLKWPVDSDWLGFETDEYDQIDPLYLIVEDSLGQHAGSMRFLPTIGPTMINDHFLEVIAGTEIRNKVIWECTRFCLAPRQEHQTALKLFLGGARLMREAGLEQLVGIFDDRMVRTYRRSGLSPTIIGQHTYDFGRVLAGSWQFDEETYRSLHRNVNLDPQDVELAISTAKLPSWVSLVSDCGHQRDLVNSA
ncbi:MAG: acyl-homoserine-lactone synthase [Halioglobus sp.]